MPSPAFTKAEADKLLGRAARLQTDADFAGDVPNLTLDDIKEAAAGAGIDPAYVDLALHLPPSTDLPAPSPYAGMPSGVVRTRLVRGQMDAATWKRIVADLRRTLGGQGRVEAEPGLYGWHRAPLHLTAETHGEYVRLVASARWDGEIRTYTGISAVMAVTLAVMGVSLLQNPSGTWGTFGVLALSLLAFTAWLWPRYRQKETRVGLKFDAALDRIETALRDAQRAPALTSRAASVGRDDASEPARLPLLAEDAPPTRAPGEDAADTALPAARTRV